MAPRRRSRMRRHHPPGVIAAVPRGCPAQPRPREGCSPSEGDVTTARCGHSGLVTERYDVIIIGTGAGGGTLAHTLAPSGKKILLLERGDFLPREMDNWNPDAGVRRREVHLPGHLVRRATASRSSRRCTTSWAGPPRCTGPRCTGCGPRTSARSSTFDGISPAWPLSYDDFEPWYTKAEWLYQVHGAHGEDPTEGHWSKQYPWPAVSHEPRIQQLADDLQAAGYHPFHAPCGILLDEADRPGSTCIRCAWCDGYPCLVHAKSDAETIAVRPLLDLPNVTLLDRRRGAEAGDRRRPAGRSPAWWSSRDGSAEVYQARHRGPVGRRREQRQDPAPLGHDAHPGGLANGSGPGRPQLHVPQQQGHGGAGQGAQRHRLPEDAGDQRLLPARRRPGMAAGQHPDARQVERGGDEGRGAEADQAGPALEPGRGGGARRGLLAHHRGPAQAGEPGDRRLRRERAPGLHRDQRGRGSRPLPRAQEDAEPRRAWPRITCWTRTST